MQTRLASRQSSLNGVREVFGRRQQLAYCDVLDGVSVNWRQPDHNRADRVIDMYWETSVCEDSCETGVFGWREDDEDYAPE